MFEIPKFFESGKFYSTPNQEKFCMESSKIQGTFSKLDSTTLPTVHTNGERECEDVVKVTQNFKALRSLCCSLVRERM